MQAVKREGGTERKQRKNRTGGGGRTEPEGKGGSRSSSYLDGRDCTDRAGIGGVEDEDEDGDGE